MFSFYFLSLLDCYWDTHKSGCVSETGHCCNLKDTTPPRSRRSFFVCRVFVLLKGNKVLVQLDSQMSCPTWELLSNENQSLHTTSSLKSTLKVIRFQIWEWNKIDGPNWNRFFWKQKRTIEQRVEENWANHLLGGVHVWMIWLFLAFSINGRTQTPHLRINASPPLKTGWPTLTKEKHVSFFFDETLKHSHKTKTNHNLFILNFNANLPEGILAFKKVIVVFKFSTENDPYLNRKVEKGSLQWAAVDRRVRRTSPLTVCDLLWLVYFFYTIDRETGTQERRANTHTGHLHTRRDRHSTNERTLHLQHPGRMDWLS